MCGDALRHASRLPYCESCQKPPEAMSADHFCLRCRTPFITDRPLDHHGVCRKCRSGLTGYDYAYSFGYYEGPLRKMIHHFKYAGVEVLSGPLGALMVQALPMDLQVDMIVPVPLHWRRRLWRGYNQCELLARPLESRLSVPVVRAIRKTRHTETQATSTPAQRRSNLTGAFVLADQKIVEGKRVLLVDDVLTTGATVTTCSTLLRRGGAKSVTVLTLARVDRRPSEGRIRLNARSAAGGAR
ncbi:MAG TPA: ComF family protein [Bryobacteraceae bacterium]|nr:ComF family protein [Bryobacteraceae bacterium]